ncbi:MAG: hypothetical protein Q9171_006180 [Xanthocarpia ochracea]
MPQSAFFDRYPHFQHNPVVPLSDEFERLAHFQRWRKGTTKWKIYRKECFDAEFELHLGSIENGKLAGWQALCQELGISGNLPSITQCKKVKKADNIALKRVHVNLCDLIDDRRAHRVPHTFRSARNLVEYTRAHKRYFPLEVAKEDSLKKILLKFIRKRAEGKGT